MGRCADFVLREDDIKMLKVFVKAPIEWRIKRKMEQENISREKQYASLTKWISGERNIMNIIPARFGETRAIMIYALIQEQPALRRR